MESSFSLIEKILESYKQRDSEFPKQEILLTRLHMHINNNLLDYRNRIWKKKDINETLFMALLILDTRSDKCIQPSELSAALSSSRTNATRIADQLEKKGFIRRHECNSDRRCLFLHLTEKGAKFVSDLISPENNTMIHDLWSTFDKKRKDEIYALFFEISDRLDTLLAPPSK